MNNSLSLSFRAFFTKSIFRRKTGSVLLFSLGASVSWAVLLLVFFNLACSKSSVGPDSEAEYFIANVDGREVNFDNDIKAQINIPKKAGDPYIFLIEANKFVGSVDVMYLSVSSQREIKATAYDNSIRSDDVFFLGGGGTPPEDRSIPTGSKVTITSLTDAYAEGTFYGEVYPRGDINNRKIIIKDGRFRVRYDVKR